MMELYSITISSDGGYVGALHSDTLFGAFCWSYAYLRGEEALRKDIILPSLESMPPVIFSNGFRQGYVPMPLGIKDSKLQDRDKEIDKRKVKNDYAIAKKMKNASLVTVDAFRNIQVGKTADLSLSQGKEITEKVVYQHNAVDREGGIVKRTAEGSHLYAIEETFNVPGEGYDIYILSRMTKESLSEVIKLMLNLGIGGKKSTGKGAFSIKTDLQSCNELRSVKDAEFFMTISNYIPAKDDPTDGRYRTLTKYAKLDREYAMSEYPFKKPFMYIVPGAVFRATGDIISKGWCGRCLSDISMQNSQIIQSGFSITIPMKQM